MGLNAASLDDLGRVSEELIELAKVKGVDGFQPSHSPN
jgi:hypothetical protein